MSSHVPKTPQEQIRDIGICLFCLFIVVPIVSFVFISLSWQWTIPDLSERTFTPPSQETQVQDAVSNAMAASGHTIYLAQCASCHGDSGDGKGTRELDRPARSFLAGGFSFGDTTQAITRVVRSGIGGTPMPGFAKTLSPGEIKAVVAYVRSLGPERVQSDANAAIVHVGDRPVVVRGKFPELYVGMGPIPRALLAGNPDGMSFMYRTDDVRFLGARQGSFARRSDWDGRGGTALELQGRLIHLVPDVPVFEHGGEPASAQLLGTNVGGQRAAVRYQVGDADIIESAGATTKGDMAGYRRLLEVHNGSAVQMRMPSWRQGGLERIGESGAWTWWQEPAFDGRMHFVGVRGAQPLDGEVIQLPERGTVEIVVFPDTAIDVAEQAGVPVPIVQPQAQIRGGTPLITRLVIAAALGAAPDATAEDRYYTVQSYTPPEGEVLEVGGLVFLPDGTLAASTRRGRVWLIDNPDAADPSTSPFTMHAEGLWEGLGLNQIDGDVLVLQRSELSRLRDMDGDRVAERIDTVANDWGLTDNYHEFAFGLPRDAQGNLYFSLNLGFLNPEWFHGKSNAPYRGWLLRCTPDGVVEPVAMGFRSPCGVGIDAQGRVLVTDNQGDWMASSPIFAVKPGEFHGHPASLRWTEHYGHGASEPEDKQPPDVERTSPAIWIPYDWSRSTGNLIPDMTGGAFGPFKDQLFVAELTNGMVLRAELEDIDGVTQGAIWPFRRQVGSACRVLFSPEGNLVLGMTNRGWGGLGPGHGLRRIDWTGELPMEMLHCRAVPGGFDIEFTRPVQGDIAASQVHARDYDYHWWWEYGSPEQRNRDLRVQSVALSPDRRHVQVRLDDLKPGRVVRLAFNDVTGEGGHALLHPEVAYTLNVLPGTGKPAHPAKPTQPPTKRIAETDAGWLRLTWGAPWDSFTQRVDGWRLGKAALDKDDASRFADEDGHDLLINDGAAVGDLVVQGGLQPGTLSFGIWLPEGGRGGVSLPGGAQLIVSDTTSGDAVSGRIQVLDSTGAQLGASTAQWMGPGQWHRVEVGLSSQGVDSVRLQDNTILNDIAIQGSAHGDLRLLASHAPVGFADVRVKPNLADLQSSARALVEEHQIVGGVDVEVDNGDMYVSGGTGQVVFDTPLPPQCTIDLDTRFQPLGLGWIDLGGTRVLLGESPSGGPKTGSIAGHDEVRAGLIADKSWGRVSIELTPHVAQRFITVRVGGLPVAQAIVPGDTVSGPLALGHQVETGWVAIRNLTLSQ